MKRLFSRRYAWLILALLALIALIPTVGFVVHAAGPRPQIGKAGTSLIAFNGKLAVPSLTVSARIVHTNQNIIATAKNFAANETVHIQLDNNSSVFFATLPCDGNGVCVV